MSTTTTAPKKRATGHFLFTYKFRKDEKDPVIDRIHTCMDDTGYDYARVARDSGVSYGTIRNWIDGDTKRPQYCTIAAALGAMGFELAVVPTNRKVNGQAWNAKAPPVVKRFRSIAASSTA